MSRQEPYEHTWERREDESSEEYDRFLAYLSRPKTDRSIVAAYRVWSGREDALDSPGNWKRNAKKHDWAARATDHDVWVSWKATLEAETAHLERLADYRKRLGNYASVSGSLGLQLLQKLVPKISSIQPSDITMDNLPKLVGMATKLLETAAITEAQALAVDELLEALREAGQIQGG